MCVNHHGEGLNTVVFRGRCSSLGAHGAGFLQVKVSPVGEVVVSLAIVLEIENLDAG